MYIVENFTVFSFHIDNVIRVRTNTFNIKSEFTAPLASKAVRFRSQNNKKNKYDLRNYKREKSTRNLKNC